tara:strand:+ start:378 stop:503 length:126 start_codon:yes stop_codon:yes gene_type:complete
MKKSLELKLLNMCENILPQTKLRSDTKLLALLKEIKKELES